jgi:hypothetical protein
VPYFGEYEGSALKPFAVQPMMREGAMISGLKPFTPRDRREDFEWQRRPALQMHQAIGWIDRAADFDRAVARPNEIDDGTV